MQFVTAEEVARLVLRELEGGNTGRDVVAALDAAVTGPSYRAGVLRDVAIAELARLEAAHGEAVAYEMLGPPRLSKLLFEAHLLKRAAGGVETLIDAAAPSVSAALEAEIAAGSALRARILSIGVAILLADGRRLLRGPRLKATSAEAGWVDLTAANVARWQERLRRLRADAAASRGAAAASGDDRALLARALDGFAIGELVGWIFATEEHGRRDKG
jgi:hypothetical protein